MAVKHWLPLAILIGVLCGCSIAELSPTVAAPPAIAPRPTATPLPRDTGWQSIAPGVEYRELKIEQGDRSDRLRLARIDPAQTRLRVLYDPDRPRRVSEWLAQSNALVAVNGNFFDPQNHALGMVIEDGQRRDGVVYEGFGGMFAISGDEVRVRWNVQEPYNGEPLTYALQNFPMLVLPGGSPNVDIDDNGRASPRTAVGQDRSGSYRLCRQSRAYLHIDRVQPVAGSERSRSERGAESGWRHFVGTGAAIGEAQSRHRFVGGSAECDCRGAALKKPDFSEGLENQSIWENPVSIQTWQSAG